MAVWSFVLAPGGDITSLVDIGSIKRHRRLHTELRPNVNRLDFRCRMDGATLQSLMANDVVELTVTRDAVPYFKGVLSPNYTAQIRDGQRYLAIIAEDFTIQKLGQTITTPQAWAGFAVCNPAAPASSLVHAIAAAAGITVASGAPTISATIPYVVVLPDDKATWAKLLEDILFDHQHVYNFNEAGQLTLARAVNAGAISPTATLTSAPGTANLRGELTITKSPEKYDDIRVNYDLVELKTGLVLFQDTTGGNDLTPASIPLAAAGDASGKDYYPLTSKIGEVYSAWKNPDGYDIWVATSAALDATYESGIVISRALTNYYRKASFAFRNTSGAEKKITKLRITGNAYVVASKNTARVSLASAKTLLEHQARYIFSDAAAQSLANSLAHYYRYADIKYSAKSALALAVGDYVTVADPVYSGISTLCRVVGVLDSPATPGAIYEYELEGAADFASIPIVTEGESVPGSSPGGFENSAYANNDPPTLNVTNLAFSSEQNPSGMIDVTVSWDYTQGASPADGFLVFYKRDVTTPGAIDIFRDPSVFVQAGGATSYQTILTLPARQAGAGTLPIHYRFGVVAFGTRRSGTVVHLAGVVEDPAWIDKTFASKIQVDGNNFWDQDTGELRAGNASSFLHVKPADGTMELGGIDLEITERDVRSYTGQGVQRRAVEVGDEAISWFNSPDTTPASPEQLRARIGRLGVGGDVLIDGSFMVAMQETIQGQLVIESTSSNSPTALTVVNGSTRLAYAKFGDGIHERIKSNGVWSSSTRIVASGVPIGYAQLSNGTIYFVYFQSSALYLMQLNGSSWGTPTLITSGATEYASVTTGPNDKLRCAYRRSSDGFIVWRTLDGTWTTESVVINRSAWNISMLTTSATTLRVCYSNATGNLLYEKVEVNGVLGEEVAINAAASYFSKYSKDINGQVRIYYFPSPPNDLRYKALSESGWGPQVSLGSIGAEAVAVVPDSSGNMLLIYRNGATTQLNESTLQRYARLGAGIIESGQNSNGSYVKFSDGTQIAWRYDTFSGQNIVPNGQSVVISGAFAAPFVGGASVSHYGRLLDSNNTEIYCYFVTYGGGAVMASTGYRPENTWPQWNTIGPHVGVSGWVSSLAIGKWK